MVFEVGKFYIHEAGRKIAVLAEVKTYCWGRMLVIEETDSTGHSISCVEAADAVAIENLWVEIGKAEWMENFPSMPRNMTEEKFQKDMDRLHEDRLVHDSIVDKEISKEE